MYIELTIWTKKYSGIMCRTFINLQSYVVSLGSLWLDQTYKEGGNERDIVPGENERRNYVHVLYISH